MGEKKGEDHLMQGILNALFQAKKGIFFESRVNANEETADVREYTFKEVPRQLFESDEIFAANQRACRFSGYYDQGHRCFGFFDNEGRVASYLWLSVFSADTEIPWTLNMRLLLKKEKFN